MFFLHRLAMHSYAKIAKKKKKKKLKHWEQLMENNKVHKIMWIIYSLVSVNIQQSTSNQTFKES